MVDLQHGGRGERKPVTSLRRSRDPGHPLGARHETTDVDVGSGMGTGAGVADVGDGDQYRVSRDTHGLPHSPEVPKST